MAKQGSEYWMGPFLIFMLVPCAAALSVGWAAKHWALAAAAIAGGLGGAFLLVAIGTPLTKILFPVATSSAVSGLVLMPMLIWRPSVSVWNRMMGTLGAVVVTHLAVLQFALAG